MGIYRLASPSRLCRSCRLLVCPCPLLKPIKIDSRATICLLLAICPNNFCSTSNNYTCLWENIVWLLPAYATARPYNSVLSIPQIDVFMCYLGLHEIKLL